MESSPRILLTVEEAARRLAIGRSNIYKHLLSGELRSVKIGRSRRVAVSELEAFVAELSHRVDFEL